MKARRIYSERKVVGDNAFVEIVIWRVPKPAVGSAHDFKYSLVLIIDDLCVLRYDNERGKGDHRHVGGQESGYEFQTLATLLEDFWNDVELCLK